MLLAALPCNQGGESPADNRGPEPRTRAPGRDSETQATRRPPPRRAALSRFGDSPGSEPGLGVRLARPRAQVASIHRPSRLRRAPMGACSIPPGAPEAVHGAQPPLAKHRPAQGSNIKSSRCPRGAPSVGRRNARAERRSPQRQRIVRGLARHENQRLPEVRQGSRPLQPPPGGETDSSPGRAP